MKRLVIILLCVFMFVGSAQAVTIEGILLSGGNGTTFGSWVANGLGWNTFSGDGVWALGVSSAAGGPLLNAPDTQITGLPFGNYYLYLEPTSPTSLGNNPQLNVLLSDLTFIAAIFQVNGANGSGTPWTWLVGDSAITMGWANGTANLVDQHENVNPGGENDFYMQVGIHAGAVPLPGAVWLLGSGLLGLGALGWRRRRL